MGKYQELIERLHSPAWWDLENDCSLLEEAEAAVRKLEEYVDTGLEPDEIKELNAELEQAKRERDAYMLCCKDLLSKGNCNECGDKDNCSYRPRPGETVRANCPLWSRPKNEESALDAGGNEKTAEEPEWKQRMMQTFLGGR